MDPTLLALLLNVGVSADLARGPGSPRYLFAVNDALDYLGEQIDREHAASRETFAKMEGGE